MDKARVTYRRFRGRPRPRSNRLHSVICTAQAALALIYFREQGNHLYWYAGFVLDLLVAQQIIDIIRENLNKT